MRLLAESLLVCKEVANHVWLMRESTYEFILDVLLVFLYHAQGVVGPVWVCCVGHES